MKWTAFHHWMRFWCWLCFRTYLALPIANDLKSRYGRLTMWLLGYAGAYAHSNRETFHLCSFFYRTKAEQDAAWDEYLSFPSTERSHG